MGFSKIKRGGQWSTIPFYIGRLTLRNFECLSEKDVFLPDAER